MWLQVFASRHGLATTAERSAATLFTELARDGAVVLRPAEGDDGEAGGEGAAGFARFCERLRLEPFDARESAAVRAPVSAVFSRARAAATAPGPPSLFSDATI